MSTPVVCKIVVFPVQEGEGFVLSANYRAVVFPYSVLRRRRRISSRTPQNPESHRRSSSLSQRQKMYHERSASCESRRCIMNGLRATYYSRRFSVLPSSSSSRNFARSGPGLSAFIYQYLQKDACGLSNLLAPVREEVVVSFLRL